MKGRGSGMIRLRVLVLKSCLPCLPFDMYKTRGGTHVQTEARLGTCLLGATFAAACLKYQESRRVRVRSNTATEET